MKTRPLFKTWTLGELLDQPPRNTGIKITKSRKALTLRFGKWKHFPYDILLSELKTERGILKWALHLADKGWVSGEQLTDFIEAALKEAGINIHE